MNNIQKIPPRHKRRKKRHQERARKRRTVKFTLVDKLVDPIKEYGASVVKPKRVKRGHETLPESMFSDVDNTSGVVTLGVTNVDVFAPKKSELPVVLMLLLVLSILGFVLFKIT